MSARERTLIALWQGIESQIDPGVVLAEFKQVMVRGLGFREYRRFSLFK